MLKKRKNFFKKCIALSVCFVFLTLFFPSVSHAANNPRAKKLTFSEKVYLWLLSTSDAVNINFFFGKPDKDKKKKDTKDKDYDKNGNRTSKKKGNGED